MRKPIRTRPVILCTHLALAFGIGFGISTQAFAVCNVSPAKLTTDDTLYWCGNPGQYDEVEINTGQTASITPLTGYGIYNQGGTLKKVSVKTTGLQADAIMQRSSANLTIGDDLKIVTTGYSADGINLAVTGASRLVVGDRADIATTSGIGVRANLSIQNGANVIIMGEDAKIITQANGENNSAGLGYGIYAGNRDRETESMPKVSSARVTVGNGSYIQTAGSKAYAVYANKTGEIELGSTTIVTTGQTAHGLVAEDGSITSGATLCGFGGRPPCTTSTFEGGKIHLAGDTAIDVDSSKGSYAMFATGAGSSIASQKADGTAVSGVYHVTGDIVANKAGRIDLNARGASQFTGNLVSDNAGSLVRVAYADTSFMNGNVTASDSGIVKQHFSGDATGNGDLNAKTGGQVLLEMGNRSSLTGNMTTDATGSIDGNLSGNARYTGSTDASAGGSISLSLADRARWQMVNSSSLTNLNVAAGTEVILGDSNDPHSGNRVDLTIANLSGNGTFYVRSDIARDGNTFTNEGDMIHITDSSSGAHKVYVRDVNLGNIAISTLGSERLRIVEDSSGGTAVFALGGDAGTGVQQRSVDVGAYSYNLGREDNTMARSAGSTYWLLAATPGNDLNSTAKNSVNLMNINYLLGYVENQTLLQRMGQLRQSSAKEGDVWGRVYGGSLDHFDSRLGGMDMKYAGMQMGADRRLDGQDGRFYVGAAAGTSKGDVDYSVGTGDVRSYHLGVYGTYMANNGFYVDGLVKYMHMKNEFNTVTGGGLGVDGSGNTNGFSIGVETGKRFYHENADTGWYLEPQGQLTYSHQNSASVHASNGLQTKLGSYDSTLGRASIIAGYSITKGKNPIDVYLKTGYIREFSGKTHYTFNGADRESYDFGGGWWDNGIGLNMQINDRHNLFMDATYAKGSRFDQKQFNIGYRYSF